MSGKTPPGALDAAAGVPNSVTLRADVMLRDCLAELALQWTHDFRGDPDKRGINFERIPAREAARLAYEYADAMLAERAKAPQPEGP